MGSIALQQGDHTAARTLYEESLAIARELGERLGIAHALSNLGLLMFTEGDYDAARPLHEDSLSIRREIGDRNGVAASLGNLGLVAHAQGDLQTAQTLFEECLATSRELGHVHFTAHALTNLGGVAHARNDDAEARKLYRECMAIRREIGDRRGIASLLEAFGVLAAAAQQPDRAARLWGAAEAVRESIGVPLLTREREELEREVRRCQVRAGGGRLRSSLEGGPGDGLAGGSSVCDGVTSRMLRQDEIRQGRRRRPWTMIIALTRAARHGLRALMLFGWALVAPGQAPGGDKTVDSTPSAEGCRCAGPNSRRERMHLRGVNTACLEWSSNGEGHILETVRSAVQDWHMTVIRLPVAQDPWFGKAPEQTDKGVAYRALVKQVIDYCAANNPYLMLDLHWSDAGEWGKNIGNT